MHEKYITPTRVKPQSDVAKTNLKQTVTHALQGPARKPLFAQSPPSPLTPKAGTRPPTLYFTTPTSSATPAPPIVARVVRVHDSILAAGPPAADPPENPPTLPSQPIHNSQYPSSPSPAPTLSKSIKPRTSPKAIGHPGRQRNSCAPPSRTGRRVLRLVASGIKQPRARRLISHKSHGLATADRKPVFTAGDV